MNINSSIKSASLHLEEPLIQVPARNAVSTVKRLREPLKKGNLFLRPLRLSNFAQEWLEAENEPLKEVTGTYADSETERKSHESNEKHYHSDAQLEVKSENFPLEDITDGVAELPHKESPHSFKTNCSDRLELGLSWLETPAKSRPFREVENQVVTPCVVKNSESSSRPKILYSTNVKTFFKTPLSSNKCYQALSFTKPLPNNSFKDDTDSKKVGKEQPQVQVSLLFNETLKEITVKNVRYIILNQLGRGGSSVVYHCYNLENKTECAIKRVTLGSDACVEGYINEVKVLERLQKCDRIVKMFDYEHLESEKLLLVVLERGGKDFSKILKDLANSTKHLPMHMLIFYWMEMLYAVKEIHKNGIIHSDLKPGNFLRAEGGLKLIDFGIASCVQEDMTSVIKNVPIGSFNYISPEAIKNEPSKNCQSPSFGKPKYKVNYKSDVWSLGCILYQLVYRKTPFQHIGHTWAKLSSIVDPKHEITYPAVDWVPLKIVSTIKKCLRYNVKDRPSVDDLIKEYEDIYFF